MPPTTLLPQRVTRLRMRFETSRLVSNQSLRSRARGNRRQWYIVRYCAIDFEANNHAVTVLKSARIMPHFAQSFDPRGEFAPFLSSSIAGRVLACFHGGIIRVQ